MNPPRFVHKEAFVSSFNLMSTDIYDANAEKGFWDEKEPQLTSTKLMLVVTELGEACEADRHGNPPDQHIPQFDSLTVELADAVIRIMDLAGRHKLKLGAAIVAKCQFNESRPHKHGKEY